MIKLVKIRRSGSKILCDAYVEDCIIPVPLIFDIASGEFSEYVLPNGYEYCKSHINHAKTYLKGIKNDRQINDNHTIMWC